MASNVGSILILFFKLSVCSAFLWCNCFDYFFLCIRKWKLFAQAKFLTANLQMLRLFAEKHCLYLSLQMLVKIKLYNEFVTVYRFITLKFQNIINDCRTR